jgi:hypothetical protein
MKLKLIQDLVINSFGIMLNANDFFSVSNADTVCLAPEDLEWFLPIYEKYGNDGLNAFMSYVRDRKVLPHYFNEKFVLAYEEIKLLNPETYSN